MTEAQTVGTGAVVLDIGGDIGAAVVYADATLAGREIEIRPAGAEWDGRHVGVHPRDLPGGQVYAAVFPSLVMGRWEVRVRGMEDSPVAALEVTGGRVATANL